MKDYRIVSIAEPDYFVIQDSRELSVDETMRRNAATGQHRLKQAPFTIEVRRQGSGPKAWLEEPVAAAEIEAIQTEERRRMGAVSAQNAQRR